MAGCEKRKGGEIQGLSQCSRWKQEEEKEWTIGVPMIRDSGLKEKQHKQKKKKKKKKKDHKKKKRKKKKKKNREKKKKTNTPKKNKKTKKKKKNNKKKTRSRGNLDVWGEK